MSIISVIRVLSRLTRNRPTPTSVRFGTVSKSSFSQTKCEWSTLNAGSYKTSCQRSTLMVCLLCFLLVSLFWSLCSIKRKCFSPKLTKRRTKSTFWVMPWWWSYTTNTSSIARLTSWLHSEPLLDITLQFGYPCKEIVERKIVVVFGISIKK